MGSVSGKNRSDTPMDVPSNYSQGEADNNFSVKNSEERAGAREHEKKTEVQETGDNGGGLKMPTAMVFVVGEMAGSGVLALPKAVDSLGWIGLVLIVVCCLLAAYTGAILGKCWVILREVYPEYRNHTRYPYPSIGYRTYGKVGRYLVSISMNATLFGVAVVFILMASEIIQQLLHDLHVHVSFCYWMIIIVGVLTPFTWLGSPKDMWPVAIGALATTAFACIIIVVKTVSFKDEINVYHGPIQVKPALLSLGTIFYAFGNHPIFPTIQHDMVEPSSFTKTVFAAFFCVLCMYLPVTAAGYVVFGSTVDENLLTSIYNVANGPALYVVQTLIVCHLMFGYVIVINPISQEFEEALNIPHSFSWKRILCRTSITLVTLFIAESIPKFGNLLGLIGGTTTALLAFFCPVFFYNKLSDTIKRPISLHQRVFHYEIMVIAVLVGISATYAAIEGIVSPDSFVPPCYVDINAAEGH
ncbi:uncharacterized protein LOC135488099 [Lineus longissimus]|uniref:uncharacterized protein LOC135488099 n=1 Tax=Lineus longissimus TaxID=88925 RepID=UPI002B4D07B7